MHNKHLHIVSFNIPFPANYGGVIDVYYKIKALHDAGIKIHLHCFKYGRDEAKNLASFCEEVHYYSRKTRVSNGLSSLPYIVKSRSSKALIETLLKDNFPILFEGIHTCATCLDHRFLKRLIIFRPANIEYQYYANLAQAETKFWKKIYFKIESIKLKHFENRLKNVDLILGISETDTFHFKQNYPNTETIQIPAFHANASVQTVTGMSSYALYHGNLEVAENNEAALFLVEKVFSKLQYPFIVSGNHPTEELIQSCEKHKHVKLIENPDEASMFRLIKNAHIHVLPTFQESGLKLKLLHALFNGKHVLVNESMLKGTQLHKTCHLASNPESWIEQINQLSIMEFTKEDLQTRKATLFPRYSNKFNAEIIKKYILEAN